MSLLRRPIPTTESGAVPLARGPDGTLVRPHEAETGVDYSCPGCGASVSLRSGDRRRAHFAHRRESCAPDSALHRSAKAQVVEVIREWKAGRGPRPCISRTCPKFGCDGGVVQDLPDSVTHALVEVRLASGHVGDVVLFRDSEPAVVIELLVTSAVSEEKAARLDLPWVELEAKELLDRPYWWVARQDGLRPFQCPTCMQRDAHRKAELEAVRAKAEELGRRTKLDVSSSRHYHPVPHVCWRCSAEIIVYAWPGGGRHTADRPPEPIPGSVRMRWTDGAGHYWVNCCPLCSAVQGDYHLGAQNAEYAVVRESLNESYIPGIP